MVLNRCKFQVDFIFIENLNHSIVLYISYKVLIIFINVLGLQRIQKDTAFDI